MIHYNDSDFMKPVFSTLVINVASIVKHFQSLQNFTEKHHLSGETNGKIFASAEMCMPAFRLEAFALEVLIPNGMKVNEDFLFIDEMLTAGVDGYSDPTTNKEHPDCANCNWLQSVIVDKGNYIWYSDPNLTDFEKEATFLLNRHLLLYAEPRIKLNPRIFKIDETFIHYTLSDEQRHYRVHREALWFKKQKYE